MVRLVPVALVFFLQINGLCGQSLVANPENIKLGKIGRGWSGEAKWMVTNPSSVPIEILEVRSGCNCVEAIAEKKRLGPAESTQILANIRTLSQAGGKSSWRVTVKYRSLEVPCNEPELLSLTATAELVADLLVEPTIISFKGLGPGQTQLQITDNRTPPIRILKTSTNLPAISTKWTENTPPGTRTLVIQKNKGTAGRGFLVLETDDPSRPRMEIPIHIDESLTTSVEVTPTRIQWTNSGTCRMVLSRPGDLLVRVEKVEMPPGVDVKILRGPGPRTTLEFRKTTSIPAASKAVVIFEKKELGTLSIDLD